jgi:NAD(P)-dependent dehydrogenase (short-subunit alcohol dehydrogenase family)
MSQQRFPEGAALVIGLATVQRLAQEGARILPANCCASRGRAMSRHKNNLMKKRGRTA